MRRLSGLAMWALLLALRARAGRVGPTGAWEHDTAEEMAAGALKYEYDRHFAHALVRGDGPGDYARSTPPCGCGELAALSETCLVRP